MAVLEPVLVKGRVSYFVFVSGKTVSITKQGGENPGTYEQDVCPTASENLACAVGEHRLGLDHEDVAEIAEGLNIRLPDDFLAKAAAAAALALR
ncbi:MAG: hypothetical protein NTY04_03395 [Candidatus Staskawiczbacteria bacterium]|nr:hypothetical protein [Candidatus Staskawiczbacteria bacterium]